MTVRHDALRLVYGFVLFTGFAAAQSPAVRIMPLGDSITYGSPVAGGYRAPLYHMLTNAAYAVDYVGTATGNASADLPEINHEGHGGWRISDPSVGLYENIFGWFEAIEDPHVVLLHIGTNDSGGGTLFTNAVDRLDALVTRIARCQPSAHIIVTTLMKRGEPNYTAITNWFNPFVPGKVAAQQALGRRVHFLDMHAYLELSDMGDNLHPNAGGYLKMANAWFPAITNIIGLSPAPNQPAPIRALGTSADRTAATLTFNKPLSPDSATNTANYAVDQGLTVTAATLGANLRTVTLATSLQAPQTVYAVTLNNIQDRTEPAALTIPADSQVTFTSPAPPALLRASGRSNRTQVDLVFSKPMSPGSATNTAHYALSGGLTVASVTISGDHMTVTLLTSEQTEGAPYTVTASDIDDESTPTPLTIPADSQASFNAYKPPMPRGYWNYVPESAAYAPVYKLDLATQPNYTDTIRTPSTTARPSAALTAWPITSNSSSSPAMISSTCGSRWTPSPTAPTNSASRTSRPARCTSASCTTCTSSAMCPASPPATCRPATSSSGPTTTAGATRSAFPAPILSHTISAMPAPSAPTTVACRCTTIARDRPFSRSTTGVPAARSKSASAISRPVTPTGPSATTAARSPSRRSTCWCAATRATPPRLRRCRRRPTSRASS
ncbi:MAG: GDSL-type esterase/lipase family protein [Kiritimatiellae bacterium]|nr:GDSL-type esterase/lipase family protein [Kiritimatiellia bacterium]